MLQLTKSTAFQTTDIPTNHFGKNKLSCAYVIRNDAVCEFLYMLKIKYICYKCEQFDNLLLKHLLNSCLTILERRRRARMSASMSMENTEAQSLSPASHPASSGPTAAPGEEISLISN